MATINDILFLISFFGYSILTLSTIYNLMTYGNFLKSKGETEKEILDNKTDNMNGMRQAIVVFICVLSLYGLGLIVSILNFSEMIYILLFKVMSWSLLLNVALFLFEIFIYLNIGVGNVVVANKSNKR